MEIIGQYKNGNYSVVLLDDGTKIKIQLDDNADFIPSRPESIDLKITDKCSMGCSFCYENCTQNGKHGDILTNSWIDSIPPFMEVAINGNDMDHPVLKPFLLKLKEKKVITNITVHQKQFINNFWQIKEYCDEGLLHGIGISVSEKIHPHLLPLVDCFPYKENIVFHLICDIVTPVIIESLKNRDYKILILGYKEVGRGKNYMIQSMDLFTRNYNHNWLIEYLHDIRNDFKVVSFDNLALEQLHVKENISQDEWDERYMGDDGETSFYIDAVNGIFAKNSTVSKDINYPINGQSIGEMFNVIRENK